MIDSLITTVSNSMVNDTIYWLWTIIAIAAAIVVGSIFRDPETWKDTCEYCGAKPKDEHAEDCRIPEVHRD